MAADVDNRQFVDSVIRDILQPGAEQLMESRYFTALRKGTLSIRQLQGFALQHYHHNVAVLKGFALGMVKSALNDSLFRIYAGSLNAELTHPDLVVKFGLALGLTEEDFERETPIYECVALTGATICGMYLGAPAQNRASALANETIVQRYSEEFDTYLRKNYEIPEEGLEFFVVHKSADIEHAARAAEAISRMATMERDWFEVEDLRCLMIQKPWGEKPKVEEFSDGNGKKVGGENVQADE